MRVRGSLMSSPLDANAIGIGSTVWIFDQNRRVYRKTGSSRGPVWREHWRPEKIIGETSRSWIVGQGWNETKIPKKGWNPRAVCFGEAEIDRQAFVVEHAYRISDLVRRLDDYDTLKKIAEMVGYKAED